MTRIALTALIAALAIACGGKSSGETTTPAADTTATANPCAAADTTNPCAAADPAAAPAAADPALIARGAKVFEDSCSLCHGDDGKGNKKTPALKGAGSLAKYPSLEALLAYTKKQMPKDDPGSLSDDDYRAVVAWMRAP